MGYLADLKIPRWVVAGAAGALGVLGVGLWLARKRRRVAEVRVQELHVYPVKGCKGHSLKKVRVTSWGLENDRVYMIVNEKGVFVSQRELPHMVLIHPDMPTERGITLRAEGFEPCEVKLDASSAPQQVQVWDDVVPAIDQGPGAAEWLCRVLRSQKLRFVRIASTAKRGTDPKYGPVGETAFSDGFPILVTSSASMDLVKRKVLSAGGPAVGIDRFRPNLHVSGCGPFEEDEMRALVVGGSVRLPLVKPCSRCTVPGVDPASGVRSVATGGVLTKVMRQHRAGGALARSAQLHKAFFSEAKRAEEVFFGQNAQVVFEGAGQCYVSVGDFVRVQW